jgi:2-hydroxy-6-oxonona-2,4-dienedioate hydrolase
MRWAKRGLILLLATGAAGCVLPYAVRMPERTPAPEVSPYGNGRMATFCGVRWHLQEWQPEGEPVAVALLIHGFSGSTFSWRHSGPALAAAGYRVLAVDMPPFGLGSREPPQLPPSTCLAQWAGQQAGALPVIVAGHSMGAAVAARVAQQMPGQARALVLVAGGLGSGTRRVSGFQRMLRFPPFGRWAEIVAHHYLLKPARFTATLASAYGREPSPDEVEAYRRPLLIAGTAPALLARRAADVALLPERLPQRVLVVWGREDGWVAPATVDRILALLPQAQVTWLDGVGHNPMETAPFAFNAALLSFLQASTEASPPVDTIEP